MRHAVPEKLDMRVTYPYNIDNRTSHASAEWYADQGWSVFKLV